MIHRDHCFKSIHLGTSWFSLSPGRPIIAGLGPYHSSVLQRQKRILLSLTERSSKYKQKRLKQADTIIQGYRKDVIYVFAKTWTS